MVGTPVTQALTLGNNGKSAMTISSIKITGTNSADFTQTNNCPATLKSATKCVVTVTFTASVLGPETAYVTITDSSAGGRIICIFSELVSKNHSVIAQFDGLSHLPRLCTFNFIPGFTVPQN